MKLGKFTAGTILVVAACGSILGFALIEFGNGINSNVSDSGGGIELAVGFMIIGGGYLVFAGTVLWVALTLISAAIVFLIHRVRTKISGQNEENVTRGQQTGSPAPKVGSMESQSPDDD